MKPYIYFVITENCNYRCRHCYLEAGPAKKDTTISDFHFRSVIDNLPKFSLELILSGGEIFTIRNTLFNYLEIINFENEKRKEKRQGKIEVTLQTNAYWATSDAKIKSTLFDLVSNGVSNLDITSNDRYHQFEGAKLKNIRRLEEIAENSGLFDYISLRGTLRSQVAPIGRAKNLNIKPWEREILFNRISPSCKGSLRRYEMQIMPDGFVYLCCMLRPKPLGNVIEQPLVDLVRQARQDPILKTINKGGFRALAKEQGWQEKEIMAMITKYTHECLFCLEGFKDGVVVPPSEF